VHLAKQELMVTHSKTDVRRIGRILFTENEGGSEDKELNQPATQPTITNK
jgi:hypothetical protein